MKSILSVFIFICLNACNGWYIAGYELEPKDIDPSVFHTIFDQDSTKHYYNGSIHNGLNWCYKHEAYENVEVK